jgi:hypothetical protein
MSRADCTAAWTKLDASKTGSVSQSQAQGVVTDFKAADTNNDGKLSQAEFVAACEKGLVTASTGTGSGGRGITEFEEGEAVCCESASAKAFAIPGHEVRPGGREVTPVQLAISRTS